MRSDEGQQEEKRVTTWWEMKDVWIILGYQRNKIKTARSRDSSSNKRSIVAMNQLYFIKLLLYKIEPSSSDRYNIFKEWGFAYCGSEVMRLDRNDIDLLLEVLEIIDQLERIYKNTIKRITKQEFLKYEIIE